MGIMGEGDEMPYEEEDTRNDQEDIEENLLRPPGVTLEAVDMVVQVSADSAHVCSPI